MAESHVISLFLLCSIISIANAEEEKDGKLELSLSTIRTKAENVAVGFLVEWAEEISVDKLIVGDEWLTEISPEISIQTGDEDSFNGLTAKLKGYHAEFQDTIIGGVPAPDSLKFFSVFPFSCGLETNREFNTINALLEVGCIPFKKLSSKYFFGLNPAIGIYLQGGYKFEIDDEKHLTDGAADESEEDADSFLLRTKLGGKGDIAVYEFGVNSKYSINLIPEAWVWYDLANDEFYHRLVGVLRLSMDRSKHFDLKYENGSGAPNFNEGDQFSANLTVVF